MPILHVEKQAGDDGDDEALKVVESAGLAPWETDAQFSVVGQRHPRVGETVTSRGRVASDTSRRGMRFVSLETDTTDAQGQPLCRSRALFVIRS